MDTAEQIYISSLALLKMLKHGKLLWAECPSFARMYPFIVDSSADHPLTCAMRGCSPGFRLLPPRLSLPGIAQQLNPPSTSSCMYMGPNKWN